MINNKITFLIFAILIFIGIFLRFYNLRNNIQFDYDQENYLAFPAKSILIDHHLTLIGPKTGVGDLYIEPFYYYLVAVFYFLFHMDPIAGALLAGTLAIISILISFILIKKNFQLSIVYYYGLIWASSFFLIDLDRTPWNPNLFPIASILVFMGLWELLYKNKKYGWMAISIGIILGLNSHFSVIFLIATTAIIILLNKKAINKFAILAFLMIILSFVPLLIFNFRHDQLITHNLISFLSTSIQGPGNFLSKLIPLTLYLLETIGRIIVIDIPSWATQIAGTIYFFALIYYSKDVQIRKFNNIFFIYLIVYILGLAFYKGSIPNYYFLGLIPPAIIGYSLIISKIVKRASLFLVLLILVYTINLIRSYQDVSRNNPASMANKQAVVAKIKENADGKPVSVVYNMDLGWSYGYEYLFYYYKVNKAKEGQADLKYMISYPAKLAPKKPDYIYGDIGLNSSLRK